MNRNIRGFTLIEMAMVVAIIALLLGGLLMPLGAQLENRRIRNTEQQLADIRDALMGFAITGLDVRLPCPDIDGDGLEDPESSEETAACLETEGELPWASLGLTGRDAWGRPFRYAPDDAYADPEGISDSLDTESGFLIRDDAGTPLTDWTGASDTEPAPNGPAAIVFSCGQDGVPNGENDNDGAVNADADCTNPGSSDGLYTSNTRMEGLFDDHLIWLSRNTLVNRLVAAGVWP
uniref:Prepilin-type N-terminal cleavage/methylation domain-containing protein n=1 Tax=Candidatus Kentrum eta TaxID=2126337 RepID=A0A450V9Y0_9GAMM|nr:MAG: prepilin-type N-terminal cleavage/methylation domain-containing protein [Candidatus Kentron sp. H]